MSNFEEGNERLQIVETPESKEVKEEEPSASGMSGDRPQKRSRGRAGRRSAKMDVRAKLERSRQSARECRARKKLRYQYLEDLVANREKAVFALRDELEMYKHWCAQLDIGLMPDTLLKITEEIDKLELESTNEKDAKADNSTHLSTVTNQNQDNMEIVQPQNDGSACSVSNGNMPRNLSAHEINTQTSNSNSRFLTKGGNETNESNSGIIAKGDYSVTDEDCFIVEPAGSSANDDSWDFVIDDGLVNVEPAYNKYSRDKDLRTLPTILEDAEC